MRAAAGGASSHRRRIREAQPSDYSHLVGRAKTRNAACPRATKTWARASAICPPTQPDLSTLLNQPERVAVADDAAADEMPAEHEGRRAGEAREQVAPG